MTTKRHLETKHPYCLSAATSTDSSSIQLKYQEYGFLHEALTYLPCRVLEYTIRYWTEYL